jgi:hypothetical protein
MGTQPYCAHCKKYFPGAMLQVHHVLIHDQRHYHDQLTNPYNCALVCAGCHAGGVVNGYEWRVYFLHCVLKAYGDAVGWWYENLPAKLRRHTDYEWIHREIFYFAHANNLVQSQRMAGANKLN